MSATHALAHPRSNIPAAARLLLSLLGRLQAGRLDLITPEGDELRFRGIADGARAALRINDWKACGAILRSGDIGFAEAYRDGLLDTADLTAVLRVALQNEAVLEPAVFGSALANAWHWLRHYLRRNSRAGSRRNIHAHYDLGNDFYSLWLDPTFTYSSAYFGGDYSATLQDAQQAKYQQILDVLRLEPGMRVLEIGCGWGGFAEYAGSRGIAVHGVTISTAQLEFAQERTRGLAGVELELCDYRDIRGEYDAVVSIEMFEAVGEAYWPAFFATVRDRLKAGGRAVVQTITIRERHFLRYRAGSDFIQQFIFPGGMLASPERFAAAARRQDLASAGSVDFGPDYAETLRRWRVAFEANLSSVRELGFDEAFIRIWRLYLCYCEAAFDASRISVMQTCLVRA
ncbi:MAG: cyclopropane-fatty-acyl-phospholipid synthase family protein [Pseudomonadota bacterium]